MLQAASHRGHLVELHSLGAVTVGAVHRHADEVSVAADGAWLVLVVGPVDEAVPRTPPGLTAAQGLLHSFAATGDAVLPELRGCFSAVVTDGSSLWAWRDQLGTQPLFYRCDRGVSWVATEARQVLVGAGRPAEVDLDVVADIFYGCYDDDTPVALKGVTRLPKASVLRTSGTGAHVRRYWDPTPLIETAGPIGRAQVQEAFDRLMSQAVDRCLRGHDVVSLSGGVDSPAVAAYGAPLHARRYGRPLPALSAVYPRFPSVDESGWIDLVAGRLGMPLVTFEPSGMHLGPLAELSARLDGPVPTVWFSEIDEFYRRAAQLGYRTILTGECAEYVIEMRAGLLPYLVKNGRWSGVRRLLAAQRRGGGARSIIARSLLAAAVPDPLLRAYRRDRRSPDLLQVPDFVDGSRLNSTDRALSVPRRRRWRLEQLEAFHGPGLSMEADTLIQDEHGVLVRRPWLDVDLWEFFLSLRAEDKFPGTRYKALVKMLLRGRLPDELLDRRTFTSFDATIMDRVDYPALERWLRAPQWRMPGVDYAQLGRRLDAQDLTLHDYIFAKDLATAHAFVQA